MDHTGGDNVIEKRVRFPVGYLCRYDFIDVAQMDFLSQPYQDVNVRETLFLPLNRCAVGYLVSKNTVLQQQLLEFRDLQSKDTGNQIWPFMSLLTRRQLTLNLLPSGKRLIVEEKLSLLNYNHTTFTKRTT